MLKILKSLLCISLVIVLCACATPIKHESANNDAQYNRPNYATVPPRPDVEQSKPTGITNYSEMKGMYFSQFDLTTMLRGKTEKEFSQTVMEAFANCASIGVNTVVVQLRPYSDAFYPSNYFPWSNYVTGTLSKNPGYDPLEIMIEQAEKYDLSFHAWINPMRSLTDAQIQKVSDKYPIKQWYNDQSLYENYIFLHTDGRWYLNPAIPEVVQLICDGVAEIVNNYDVDAIHIDDYFYPSGMEASSDRVSYNDYISDGGNLSLADWRRDNTSYMVKKIYETVKYCNPNVLFGVSPAGNMSNNYDKYYADVERWVKNPGYLDYLAPQIYFPYDSTYSANSSFTKALNQFNQMEKDDSVSMVIALASYKLGGQDSGLSATEKPLWQQATDISVRQITDARKINNYGGIIFYRYDSLFNPANKDHVQEEVYNISNLFQ